MILLKCFKEFYYDINLSPIQTIGKIKSKTHFSSKLNRVGDSFEGSFKENTFKIQFVSSGNISYHDSFKPIFSGIAKNHNSYTRLVVRMKPNIGMYGILIFSIFFLLLDLLFLVFSVPVDVSFYVASLIMSLGFMFVLFFGTANIKYKAMKTAIKEIFSSDIVNNS